MEERRRSLILLLELYMFLYMLVKHVVDIQTLFLQGEWEKCAILSLVYKSMGHKDMSIWSQEEMYGFVDRCKKLRVSMHCIGWVVVMDCNA